MATIRYDFGTGFDVTESPTGEFNITLDASEVNAAPGNQAFGDVAAAGTAATFSSSDHRHGMPSFATPAFTLGTANAAGSATTPIRSDATLALFDTTAPVTQAFGDAAAVGTAAFAARRDHRHGMPATPSTAPTNAEYWVNAAHADLSAELLMVRVRNGTDDTVNNTTTLANATEMSFSVGANETWGFLMFIRYSTNATADIKFAFTVPASATWDVHAVGKDAGATLDAQIAYGDHSTTVKDFTGTTATRTSLALMGTVVTGGTSGSLQLQFAQQTANASDTTVLANSWIIAWRLSP